ncbi:Zinc finger CW-type PWWP domain protein 2, partial [Galemys pyrenaicus]
TPPLPQRRQPLWGRRGGIPISFASAAPAPARPCQLAEAQKVLEGGANSQRRPVTQQHARDTGALSQQRGTSRASTARTRNSVEGTWRKDEESDAGEGTSAVRELDVCVVRANRKSGPRELGGGRSGSRSSREGEGAGRGRGDAWRRRRTWPPVGVPALVWCVLAVFRIVLSGVRRCSLTAKPVNPDHPNPDGLFSRFTYCEPLGCWRTGTGKGQQFKRIQGSRAPKDRLQFNVVVEKEILDNEKIVEYCNAAMDSSVENMYVNKVWVQCEDESCLKWRLLSSEDAGKVDHNEPWYCFMNTDSRYNKCSISEEDFPEESQLHQSGFKIVYSQLPLGSLVLVKLQNWPSWPGILCPDPFKGKYVTYDLDGNVEEYHIEFLGDPHSRSWISATFVGHYSITLK